MPILATFAAAQDVLITQLLPLQIDVAFQLAPINPAPYVDVVKLSNEPKGEERVGRAYVALSGSDDRAADWGFYARRATILATCAASEFAGALESAARAPIHETLASALENLVDASYTTLRDAGLLGCQTRRVRGGVTGNVDGPDIHFVDVEITFVYLPK